MTYKSSNNPREVERLGFFIVSVWEVIGFRCLKEGKKSSLSRDQAAALLQCQLPSRHPGPILLLLQGVLPFHISRVGLLEVVRKRCIVSNDYQRT